MTPLEFAREVEKRVHLKDSNLKCIQVIAIKHYSHDVIRITYQKGNKLLQLNIDAEEITSVYSPESIVNYAVNKIIRDLNDAKNIEVRAEVE